MPERTQVTVKVGPDSQYAGWNIYGLPKQNKVELNHPTYGNHELSGRNEFGTIVAAEDALVIGERDFKTFWGYEWTNGQWKPTGRVSGVLVDDSGEISVLKQPSEPQPNAEVYYRCNEGAGGYLTSDKGPRIELRSGAKWSSDTPHGKGNSIEVTAGNNCVAEQPIEVTGSQLTIAAWVKPRSFIGSSRDGRIVSKGSSTAGRDHVWMLSTIRSGGDTVLRARLAIQGKGVATMVADSGLIQLDQWHHVAFTYDGSAMRLWKNAEIVGVMQRKGELLTDSSIDVAIGNNPPGAGFVPWDGHLKDILISPKAYSQAELRELMGSEQPEKLQAILMGKPASGVAPLEFEYDSSPSRGEIERRLIQFGDGDVSTQMTGIHTYLDPGNYGPTLTIWDAEGNSDDAVGRIEVKEKPVDPDPELEKRVGNLERQDILTKQTLDQINQQLESLTASLVTLEKQLENVEFEMFSRTNHHAQRLNDARKYFRNANF